MDVRIAGVKAVIAVLERVANVDPREALEEIGAYLHRRVIENFERQSDPWGRPWEPLSPETVARKGSSRILEDTGGLRQSIAWRLVGSEAVAVGTNLEYAPVHQFGAKRKNIPERPFLPVAETGVDLPGDHLADVIEILERYYGFPA